MITVRLTRNDDGWWTAQIAEFRDAISQGSSPQEAASNALDAMRDLGYEDGPAW